MRFPIKAKLVLAITALMATVFLMISFLFINEKKVELADDVFVGVKAFAELTAPDISELTDLYLEEEGFVYFNRDIQKMFEQNTDVKSIAVVSYDGELVYDSEQDKDKKYSGEERNLDERFDTFLISQVKAKNSSFHIPGEPAEGPSGEVYYLKDGEFVDFEEKVKADPEKGFKIGYFVQPAGDKYSVVYGVSYNNMDARVSRMINRILATAGFGFLLGVVLAFLMGTTVTRPVKKLVAGADAVAKGDFKYQVDIKSRDELGFLGGAFNKMAQDLGASVEARVYKERMGREIELARKIQEEIIPKSIPQMKGVDVAAGILPATEVGGDMYDFIPVDIDSTLMYLGDVTGHGVPSCIVGAVANSLFYSYAGLKDLKSIIVDVNAVLKKKTMSTMFMTLCLLKWDSAKKVLSYVNAGHDPLLYFSAKNGKVIEGEKGGVAVGMVSDISAQAKEVSMSLSSGDVVVVYSDGLLEAWKNDKEQYGMERLKKAVHAASGLATAGAVKDAIMADVAKFTAGFEQKDDMTILVVKKV
jgi:HAMP domain-containing protein